jgi:hypothetical protein
MLILYAAELQIRQDEAGRLPAVTEETRRRRHQRKYVRNVLFAVFFYFCCAFQIYSSV